MRRILFFPLVLLAYLLPSAAAWAGYHSAPIIRELTSWGVPMFIAQPVAIGIDNLIHIWDHTILTVQMIVSDPTAAIFMLNEIGAACFTQTPPWSHLFFASAGLAIISSLVVIALAALSILLALRLGWKMAMGRHNKSLILQG